MHARALALLVAAPLLGLALAAPAAEAALPGPGLQCPHMGTSSGPVAFRVSVCALPPGFDAYACTQLYRNGPIPDPDQCFSF